MAFGTGLITKEDLLKIEDRLYSPREEELIARKIFAPNNEYPAYASEIGYDYYQRTGSAKILSRGAGANDVPFVGEKGGRNTQAVYDIVSGFQISRAELEAMEAKRALGKGPSVNLPMTRIDTARRYIYERFNRLCFVGDDSHGIKGIFDSSFYGTDLGTAENVALGATGGDDAAKRLWSNKTPKEIITDLNTAVSAVEGTDGLFKARVLVLPPSAMQRLRKPYSDYSPMTTLNWIQNEGMYFEQIITSRVMSKTINGDTVDWFMVLDNDPEIVQHVITKDIYMPDAVYDIRGNYSQAVELATAGLIVRHPSGLYIGKGIG